MTTTASGLLDALTAAGVTIAAPSSDRLTANPGSRVTPALAAGLKRFKLELVGTFRRARIERNQGALVACSSCNADFTTAPRTRCPWCEVSKNQTVTPGGSAEIAYLMRQNDSIAAENSEVGTVGTVGTVNPETPYTRTQGRITGNAVPTVPNCPQPSPLTGQAVLL